MGRKLERKVLPGRPFPEVMGQGDGGHPLPGAQVRADRIGGRQRRPRSQAAEGSAPRARAVARLGGRAAALRLRRPVGAGIGALSTALILAAVVGWAQAGPAGADATPTQGSSYAQSLQITPHEGSLAVGAVFGEALAGHTNTFARSQSEGVDLGSVGDSMQGYNCNMAPNTYVYNAVPTPLIAESGTPGAAQGLTQGPSPSDQFSTYGSNEYALANDTPYGEADTTFAGPVADPTNAFSLSGTHSKSWSGVVNGVTEAGASSDIKSLNLDGGAVVLNDLDWQAVYPTGSSSAQPSGSFTIGQVVVNGLPVPDSADLSAVQTAVNTVLSTVGIELQLPQVYVQQGTEFVSPLELEVVPNTTRDSILDPAIVALQPNYYQIANGLENGFGSDTGPLSALGAAESSSQGQQLAGYICESDTPITVADITIAAFDGGGYFSAALGGVNASSSPLPTNDFNLAALGLGNLTVPSSSQLVGALPGTAASAPSPTLGTTAAAAAPSAAPPATSSVAPQSIRAQPAGFAAGGPLLAAGLAGLGLLLLLIEGDRRMMRRAQRTRTFEE